MPTLTPFAAQLTTENAFDVLALARRLRAAGKQVIELQIGDSPFRTTRQATQAGLDAIQAGRTGYAPSQGLPEFRQAASAALRREFAIDATPDQVVVAPGAKPFQTFFCEAYLEPGDGVLVWDPAFPTYVPNILRRGAEPVLIPLLAQNAFRPQASDVRRFVESHPRPRAIILCSPHNPTGGVATRADLEAIAAECIRADLAVFSDEPYCHMVWAGEHTSIAAIPGMLDRTVAAYTFSKSYSMSGWRLGYAVARPDVAVAMAKMVNSSLSCVPPFVQLAGMAALQHDTAERDEVMQQFQRKVRILSDALAQVPGVRVAPPAGTFYVFPDVRALCEQHGLTSHGLAMYLLEGADDDQGVACLGGECFGHGGAGFLRFSCAADDQQLVEAVAFLADATTRTSRIERYREQHPEYRIEKGSQHGV
jgi:aspartate aminotransferase